MNGLIVLLAGLSLLWYAVVSEVEPRMSISRTAVQLSSLVVGLILVGLAVVVAAGNGWRS